MSRMRPCFFMVFAVVALLAGLLRPAQAAETAWTFRFPIDGFAAGSYSGRSFLHPSNHVGDDSLHSHRTPVVAVANGVVKQVRRGNSQGYGSVVVVEHALPSGEVVQSIYGHLCNHAGNAIVVNIGQSVTKGQLLGYVGDNKENEDGTEHLHLGIRKGAYDGHYCGYVGPSCQPSNFLNPTDFINARSKAMVLTSAIKLSSSPVPANVAVGVVLPLMKQGEYGGNFQFRVRAEPVSGGAAIAGGIQTVWFNPGATGTVTVPIALPAGSYRLYAENLAPGTSAWWSIATSGGAQNPIIVSTGAQPSGGNAAPVFVSSYLPPSVVYPARAYFSGQVTDDAGLSSIRMTVSGPRGNNIVAFSAGVSGTSRSLSSFYFDSKNTSYANVKGSYTVTLWVTDSGTKVTARSFSIVVR